MNEQPPAARTFIATTGKGLARAQEVDGQWEVTHLLADQEVLCLASDPLRARTVYAGTRGAGVLRSQDGGRTWLPAGLFGREVKAIAASPLLPGAVYAGLKPALLFVSHDSGANWTEIEPFRRARSWWWRSPAELDLRPYIQGLALSPADANVLLVGIEAGAVLRTEDGGQTWEGHRPGSLRDCHTLTFHATKADWVYEAGGTGGGAAYSRDGGRTWQQSIVERDRQYGWAVAADPDQPEVWYVSAAAGFNWRRPGPPAAHVDGHANACIFRAVGGGDWYKLSGGLPQPLNFMAYALITNPAAPGHLYAGLSNGDVWHSTDHGDSWQQLPFTLKGIHRTLIML